MMNVSHKRGVEQPVEGNRYPLYFHNGVKVERLTPGWPFAHGLPESISKVPEKNPAEK